MKIRVSYRTSHGLEFLRFVEAPNIELARKRFQFSQIELSKLPSKSNLVFQYEELIEASKNTSKVRNSVDRRMLLFMKHCPNFKVVKTPHSYLGFFGELYEVLYLEDYIVINVTTSYMTRGECQVFKIKLR